MKLLERIFGLGKRKEEETYIEITPQIVPEKPERKIDFFVVNLGKLEDVRGITEKIRMGAIVLIDFRELQSKSKEDLKNAIDKIKMVAEARNSKIYGIAEGFAIVVPEYVEVKRG